MTEEAVIQILRYTFYTVGLLSAPIIGVILVVGIVSNILQTVTQIRDQAISFVPKVIAVGVTVVLCIPWFFAVLSKYVHLVFSLFEQVTQ